MCSSTYITIHLLQYISYISYIKVGSHNKLKSTRCLVEVQLVFVGTIAVKAFFSVDCVKGNCFVSRKSVSSRIQDGHVY